MSKMSRAVGGRKQTLASGWKSVLPETPLGSSATESSAAEGANAGPNATEWKIVRGEKIQRHRASTEWSVVRGKRNQLRRAASSIVRRQRNQRLRAAAGWTTVRRQRKLHGATPRKESPDANADSTENAAGRRKRRRKHVRAAAREESATIQRIHVFAREGVNLIVHKKAKSIVISGDFVNDEFCAMICHMQLVRFGRCMH